MAQALIDTPLSGEAVTRERSAEDFVPGILYVMGTGRSGTTILEVLLTNSQGVTGTGELKHIFRDGFVRNVPCACGQPARECELWSEVLKQSNWSREECIELGRAIESLEGHGAFPRLFLGAAKVERIQRHREATARIFRAVRRTTHCDVIVDSSKYPSRALLLDRAFPDKVRVVCITRSAAGLLAAFRKKNESEQRPKTTLVAAAYYLYVLFCMRLVKARLKDRCFVIRFEDLNRDPVGTLKAIEDWSGYCFAGSRARIAAGETLDVGHIVTGNRLRKKGRVQFEPSSSNADAGRALIARVLETYRKVLGF